MRQASLDMITKLIGFDTVSRNSNLDLINYVRNYLDDFKIESYLVSNDEGTKSNLFASIGPREPGGVVLSGHTDVVPVDGQPWNTNPFIVTEKQNRLYGRGTCDMKSFIAVGLAMIPQMLEAKMQRPIHFALSYDEEVGCAGAPAMIDRMRDEIPKPSAVIIGEPSNMAPVMAHKGLSVATTHVRGYEAHSSQMQRGVSAVMTAAKLITFLEGMMAENRKNADKDSLFVPPYSTIHVGTINGGTAVNIISRDCSFDWDLRILPGETVEQYKTRFAAYCDKILAEMRAIHPETNIYTEWHADAPPLNATGDTSAQEFAKQLSGHPCCKVVPYATEGGLFQERGFSVVVCGPGSIDQAHQPNEYIEISQVQACEEFIGKVIKRMI